MDRYASQTALQPDATAIARLLDLQAAAVARRIAASWDVSQRMLTGIGDLGNIPRLVHPLKALASRRSAAFDRAHARVAARHDHAVKFPIAELTDARFRSAEMFCADLFHPNRIGHMAWADAAYPYIADALARAAEAAA